MAIRVRFEQKYLERCVSLPVAKGGDDCLFRRQVMAKRQRKRIHNMMIRTEFYRMATSEKSLKYVRKYMFV